MNDKWHSIAIEDVLKDLETSADGLSLEEASKRLNLYGENVLPKEKKVTILELFLRQINNPISYILILTIFFSFVIGETIDAIFVIFVVLLDGVLGTFQEWKAEKNAESLQKIIKVSANVFRDGKEMSIDAKNLVKGDIVRLDSGDKVPADLRLISVHNLAIDESILTGESFASPKSINILDEDTLLADRKNMAYAGTAVVRGRAIGVVVATSIDTEIGAIANRVLLTENTDAPLVIKMKKFTKQIGLFTAIIALILTVILYFKGFASREIFFSVVALSISAIPEGLPVALTLALSIASTRMAKKNVLVRRLKAVEGLGNCTVIASDKTGTLTLNEQTAKVIMLPNKEKYKIEGIGYNGKWKVLFKNRSEENILEIGKLGVLNNEAYLELVNDKWNHFGDSIDVAFLALAYKLNFSLSKMNDMKKRIVGSIPYESIQKYSAVFYEEKDTIFCTVKGSLEKVLSFCDKMQVNNKEVKIDKELLYKFNNKLSEDGYRVIAMAKGKKKDFENKDLYASDDIPSLTLIGLVGFIDPIREETTDAIKKCHRAGIKTVMVTGDHPLTAFHIAKELKITSSFKKVTTGKEIDEVLKKGYKEFDKFVKGIKIFTRVNPNQKYEIIESYRRQGEFVAVTGDGVNDALALKSANLGIAMGSGTDVTKETGSMIITDDNFHSIVSGIEEGRIAYDNIRKVVYMLLSCNFGEVLFFTLAILFGYPMPLIAVQLLWLNLVTDGIQDSALAFEKGEKDIMKRKVRSPNEPIFDSFLLKEMLVSGTAIGLIVFALWVYLIDYKNFDVVLARSYVVLLMVFIQNIHIFNCRSETNSIFKIPFKNNPFIVISIMVVLILQFVVVENSILSHVLKLDTIPIFNVILVFVCALPILIIMEIFKYYHRKKQKI